MGAIAAVIGAIGGLSAVTGIVTAAEVIPLVAPQFTWTFWFALATILLLSSIAIAIGHRGYE